MKQTHNYTIYYEKVIKLAVSDWKQINSKMNKLYHILMLQIKRIVQFIQR